MKSVYNKVKHLPRDTSWELTKPNVNKKTWEEISDHSWLEVWNQIWSEFVDPIYDNIEIIIDEKHE